MTTLVRVERREGEAPAEPPRWNCEGRWRLLSTGAARREPRPPEISASVNGYQQVQKVFLMNEANLNPYQSPQGTSDKEPSPEQEQLSLAELQARVIRLEKQLQANHLFGPLWKRCLAVFIYFFLAYAVIGAIVGTVFLAATWLLWFFWRIEL